MTQMIHDFPRLSHYALSLRLADGCSDLLIRQVALLRDCVALAQQRFGFEIVTACVLPSELQMLVRAHGDQPLTSAVRLIRSAFARHGTDAGTPDLWEPFEPPVRVPLSALKGRSAFILSAPVRAGLAARPEDWPYSSLHHRGAPQAAAVA